MNQVTSWLWIGDANDGQNWQAIHAAGIRSVFNATAESDGWPAEFKKRVPYLRLNQPDGEPIPPERLDLFAAWLSFQERRGDLRLLVHCGAGISRAATFSALALMLRAGLAWGDALSWIRAARPIVCPNPALMRSLADWWRARGGEEWALAGMPPL